MEAKRTPLIELLERVPRDAVLVVEHGQFSSSSHPVGRLCHEAAAALEAAREDAERLDWLDANGSAVRLKGNSRRNLIIWGAMHVPSYRTIRHAIDQARGEEEGNGQ